MTRGNLKGHGGKRLARRLLIRVTDLCAEIFVGEAWSLGCGRNEEQECENRCSCSFHVAIITSAVALGKGRGRVTGGPETDTQMSQQRESTDLNGDWLVLIDRHQSRSQYPSSR